MTTDEAMIRENAHPEGTGTFRVVTLMRKPDATLPPVSNLERPIIVMPIRSSTSDEEAIEIAFACAPAFNVDPAEYEATDRITAVDFPTREEDREL